MAVKASIIGISGFGACHFTDLMREVSAGRLEAVGAAVINQDEEAEKCAALREAGCEIFPDHHSLLSRVGGRCDLCMIPTGIHLHAPMTIDALRAGMNVFVEKPAAATIQGVRKMQQAEREARRFVAVGYQDMYHDATLNIKRAILDGIVGEVRSIACAGLWPRADAYYRRAPWAGVLRLGTDWVLDSPMHNAFSHYLNLLCFFAGRSLHASAGISSVQAELYRAHQIASCDTCLLRAETDRGARLHFAVTHCSERNETPLIEVRGALGTLVWLVNEPAVIRRPDGSTSSLPGSRPPSDRTGIMDRLLQRLHAPDTFICSLDIASVPVLCVNAAHELSAIHTIPDRWINRTPVEGDVKTVVSDVDALIRRSFREEKLFSEMGVPWARAGAVVPVAGYDCFAG